MLQNSWPCLRVFLRFSMVFTTFFHGFPTVFPRFSHVFSHGFPRFPTFFPTFFPTTFSPTSRGTKRRSMRRLGGHQPMVSGLQVSARHLGCAEVVTVFFWGSREKTPIGWMVFIMGKSQSKITKIDDFNIGVVQNDLGNLHVSNMIELVLRVLLWVLHAFLNGFTKVCIFFNDDVGFIEAGYEWWTIGEFSGVMVEIWLLGNPSGRRGWIRWCIVEVEIGRYCKQLPTYNMGPPR